EATPPGFAPEEVRSEWVGLSLPVRFSVKIDLVPEVSVIAIEALQALKDGGRRVASDWREEYYAQMGQRKAPLVDAEGYDAYMANVSLLVFGASCGTLQPDPDSRQNWFIHALADPLAAQEPPAAWPQKGV